MDKDFKDKITRICMKFLKATGVTMEQAKQLRLAKVIQTMKTHGVMQSNLAEE